MSAVLTAPFGDTVAIREASVANAAHYRARQLGYSRTTAAQFARQAKREASDWESPTETALRIVRPPHASATRTGPGPFRPAA